MNPRLTSSASWRCAVHCSSAPAVSENRGRPITLNMKAASFSAWTNMMAVQQSYIYIIHTSIHPCMHACKRTNERTNEQTNIYTLHCITLHSIPFHSITLHTYIFWPYCFQTHRFRRRRERKAFDHRCPSGWSSARYWANVVKPETIPQNSWRFRVLGCPHEIH